MNIFVTANNYWANRNPESLKLLFAELSRVFPLQDTFIKQFPSGKISSNDSAKRP